MDFATFDLRAPAALMATAVHAGHELRPALALKVKVDESVRLREEDPYSGSLAARVGPNLVVNRSRFEVDLNRERDRAVYVSPADAWGIEVWGEPLTDDEIEESLALYDRFYDDLAQILDGLVDDHGGFVLYDIHSYNHRRSGPDVEPEPAADNPVVNLGTGFASRPLEARGRHLHRGDERGASRRRARGCTTEHSVRRPSGRKVGP